MICASYVYFVCWLVSIWAIRNLYVSSWTFCYPVGLRRNTNTSTSISTNTSTRSTGTRMESREKGRGRGRGKRTGGRRVGGTRSTGTTRSTRKTSGEVTQRRRERKNRASPRGLDWVMCLTWTTSRKWRS